LTVETVFLRASLMKPLISGKHGYRDGKVKGTSLSTPTVMLPHNRILLSHFRPTRTGYFQSHSHYCEEDGISFRVLCNVR